MPELVMFLRTFQIANLQPTICAVRQKFVNVTGKLLFTMADTKVINDITGTVSQACYICGCSGKKLNDSQENIDIDDPERFKYGFSPLHAYIRTMELFLKISFRLCMKKPTWRVSKSNTDVKERESHICTEMRQRLGVRINEPLPGGGNSNDGNTARKFFQEFKEVCSITGLDRGIMERMHVILMIVNSRQKLNYEAYHLYAEETRRMYVKIYGWYPLSPTVHKLLVHGGSLIKHAILPIGLCSEVRKRVTNQ